MRQMTIPSFLSHIELDSDEVISGKSIGRLTDGWVSSNPWFYLTAHYKAAFYPMEHYFVVLVGPPTFSSICSFIHPFELSEWDYSLLRVEVWRKEISGIKYWHEFLLD